MELAATLTENPQILHGDVKLCFTCDEEIGNSTKYFDLEKFNCDFAYSMDGGELGEFYYDNFNCGIALVTVNGKVAHTGYAWHGQFHGGGNGTSPPAGSAGGAGRNERP